jgi:GntR family transcriptional regulator/MocR family aminotransferase
MLTYSFADAQGKSLYAHLYECIKQDIEEQSLNPGEKLPSKRSLARHLNISLITVEHAYSQLIAEGYIFAIEKKGYFVSETGSLPIAHRNTDAQKAGTTIPGQGQSKIWDRAFDFTGASMPARWFPIGAWTRAMREALSLAEGDRVLRDNDAQGIPQLRQAISEHLARYRGLHADPSCIIVGAGAQYLYGLVIQLLGRNLHYAIEDPGYRKLERIYTAHDATVSCIPIDDAGISARALQAAQADVAHITPSHQFPTGIVMPIARRNELLAWAGSQADRWIVEDDYDCEFRLSGQPIPTLQSIDDGETVLYMNTFTKSMAPDIRIAYLVLPASCMDAFNRKLGFYSCTVPAVEQTALAAFIRNGDFERHLNRTRKRCRTIRDAIVEEFGRSPIASILELEGTDAGLHFILQVQDAAEEMEIVEEASRAGVLVKGISTYRQAERRMPGETARLVINYSGMEPDEARTAANILCTAIERTVHRR